jgi:P27 family predicted phage terminase small subunit
MKGRPPKSTAELKKKGTFEKCKQGDRAELPPVDGIPPAPAGFTTKMAEWWVHYIKDIQSFTTLGEPHLNAVALLCKLMVERETLDKDVQEKGHTFETSSGQIKINPAFTARVQIDGQIMKLYEQFGFTLRSSMTIKTDKPKQQTSRILEMMKGGTKKKVV